MHNKHNFSQHIADPEKPDDGLFLYFFPVCTLNVYGGGMTSFRVCPTADPHVTRMEFDYYHMETGEKFEEYFKFVRQVALEDFELCEKAQENLAKGVYHEGILNPRQENGVSCRLPVTHHRIRRPFLLTSPQIINNEFLKWLLSSMNSTGKVKTRGVP